MAYFYSSTSYAYQLGLYVHTVSQNIENNTSTVYWRIDLLKNSSAYAIYGGSGIFYVALHTGVYLNESIYFAISAGETSIGLRDGYAEIPHNADGTMSFGVGFSFTPQTSAAYFPGSMSGNGTYVCTTIPRATTPALSATSVELEKTVDITCTPATSSFSHKLYYQIGSANKVAITTLAAGTKTYSWTVPEGIADSITSSASGTIQVVCETYSGTTLIGTKSVDLTVTMPSTMVPTISSVTIAEATAGLAAKFGAYVQGKSTLSIATSASGVHGSTIDSIAVDVGGTAYSGASVTTGVLNTSGSVTVTVTVTDSRGRTAVSSSTVSVTAYSAPTITVAEAVRCGSDGTVNEEGTYIKFTYKFNVAPVGDNNDKSFKIQYKNGNTWTDLYTVSAYTGDSSYVSTVTFSIDNTYDVRFVATDYFSTTTIQKQVVPSFVLMDFGAGGKSMAIGQRSSNNGKFEVDLPSVFHNGAVLASKMRVTSMNIAPSADKRSSVEHYLATSSCSTANGKPAYDSHIIHLHWDNESGYDIQIALPDVVRSDTAAQEIQAGMIQYRTQNGKSGAWHPWRNAALNSYPVGSTYESTSDTSPATLFGGTWTQIQTHETLTVTGTKVVSSSTYDGNMHTLDQVKDLFEEKYGFRPTLSGTVSAKQQTFDGTNVVDSTYKDLGVIYYNGHWEASNQTLVPILTQTGQLAVRMSATGLTMRVNYTYITHRAMYKWTRTA